MNAKNRKRNTPKWLEKRPYYPERRSDIPKVSKRHIGDCAVIKTNFNQRKARRGA